MCIEDGGLQSVLEAAAEILPLDLECSACTSPCTSRPPSSEGPVQPGRRVANC